MCFIDPIEFKFQVWLDSIKSELRYKLSNMISWMGWVGFGVGLQTGIMDKLRLIKSFLIGIFDWKPSSSLYHPHTNGKFNKSSSTDQIFMQLSGNGLWDISDDFIL